MPREIVPLKFPISGIVETIAHSEQLPGTAPDLLNVRPHDSLDSRLRGGQRSGTAKYFEDAVNSTNQIQRIDSIALAFDSSTVVPDLLISADPNDTTVTESFTYSDGDLEDVSSARWNTYEDRSGSTDLNELFETAADNSDQLQVVSNVLTVPNTRTGRWVCVDLATEAVLGSAYILRYDLVFPNNTSASRRRFVAHWRLPTDPTSPGLTEGWMFTLERRVTTNNMDGFLLTGNPLTQHLSPVGTIVAPATVDFNARL